MRKTMAGGWGGGGAAGKEEPSFFKTTRSTAMSSSDSIRDDSHVSDLVSNTDRVLAGSPMNILRNRKKKEGGGGSKVLHSISGAKFSKDIFSLINEFH